MSQDQKRDAIIEAAIKRFAHFGVAKTTMTEIATDLSISKALLYYYFPDKLNLYAGVLKAITEEAGAKDKELIDDEKDPHKAIHYFLERRTEFIIRYHNILEYLKSVSPTMPDEIKQLFEFFRNHELGRISMILEKGRLSNKFKIEDSKKTAELYLDSLHGLRTSILTFNTNFFPDKKQFQAILKREKQFTTIFFNGLSC
jgi:TetR/AcrR family transcriptional regulator